MISRVFNLIAGEQNRSVKACGRCISYHCNEEDSPVTKLSHCWVRPHSIRAWQALTPMILLTAASWITATDGLSRECHRPHHSPWTYGQEQGLLQWNLGETHQLPREVCSMVGTLLLLIEELFLVVFMPPKVFESSTSLLRKNSQPFAYEGFHSMEMRTKRKSYLVASADGWETVYLDRVRGTGWRWHERKRKAVLKKPCKTGPGISSLHSSSRYLDSKPPEGPALCFSGHSGIQVLAPCLAHR